MISDNNRNKKRRARATKSRRSSAGLRADERVADLAWLSIALPLTISFRLPAASSIYHRYCVGLSLLPPKRGMFFCLQARRAWQSASLVASRTRPSFGLRATSSPSPVAYLQWLRSCNSIRSRNAKFVRLLAIS